ncbi:MAG: heat-shock protein Hsp20 [Flavobacteriaceae bacterium]|jgi:HSP20 family protein|nr:heat-shock protein Hsp20 [Flavobacteriaceae bacterium]|tara:strand:- start:1047 stop:1460 length:414 start_codon:yes stop_codon:yes gene_type:complete
MNLIRKQNTWFPSVMDDFLNTNWNINVPNYSNTLPAVNIIENDTDFILHIAAPGLNKNDFELSIENKVLSIEVVKDPNNDDFTRQEFDYTSFKRTFSIPKTVEKSKISASYTNGVLNITLPKTKDALTEPKKLIKIK